jgi:hypothetical protein
VAELETYSESQILSLFVAHAAFAITDSDGGDYFHAQSGSENTAATTYIGPYITNTGVYNSGFWWTSKAFSTCQGVVSLDTAPGSATKYRRYELGVSTPASGILCANPRVLQRARM